MDDWKQIELNDACSRLSSGKSISAKYVTSEGIYPIYGGNGIRGYTDNIYNFDGECAIIGRQGAYCGNVRYFSGKAYMTEHAVVTCGNESSNTRFLAYLLSTMQLGRLSGQSAQPGLSVKTIGQQVIKLPPLKVQNIIADMLTALDEKIEVNESINKNLMEQALTLYTTHFTTLEKNGCIGDYCSIKSGFAFKSSWWTDSGIKVIKIGSINQDNLNLLECSYVDENKINKVNDFKVRAGDLLIAMTGATIGKFAMVPYSSETLLVNQRVGKFFLGNKPVEKLPFIYCTLKQPDVYYEIVNRGQGSAQPNISGSDIMSIPCVIPSKEAIDEFNCINQPLFDLIISNQRENQQLSKIRDTILPKLMSGELDVSDIDL